ncbi:40S ribosomal protein S20 [Nosema granulosis]|uniref:40S ribosomal protein S20 n=1 Tax=Nosema granulosis TaxID=83296 RepID=A0A9P6H1B0_9MICR|nr:40S ribosomal protein S20 [Nosema granulosis]
MEVEMKKQELEPIVNTETMRVTFDLTSTKKSQIETAVEKFEIFARDIVVDTNKVVLPNNVGTITTLKTPCGQGFKTWSRYKLVVHHRRFILTATHDQLEKIVQFLKTIPHVQITVGFSE